MVRDARDPPPIPRANAVRDPGERIAELLAANNAEVERRRKAEARADDLLGAMMRLRRAYVAQMASGHERIKALGGECDPVDRMEQGDPELRAADTIIGEKSHVG
jgi:hypothetical protein